MLDEARAAEAAKKAAKGKKGKGKKKGKEDKEKGGGKDAKPKKPPPNPVVRAARHVGLCGCERGARWGVLLSSVPAAVLLVQQQAWITFLADMDERISKQKVSAHHEPSRL